MPEWERGGSDGASSEEALERTLRELGPLLRRRAQVGAPDPAFVAHLRARLAAAEPAARAPGSARATASRAAPWWHWRGLVAGLAAAAVAAVLGVLVLVSSHQFAPTWRPPLPSVADLTRGFPAPASAHAAGALSPTVSLAAPPHGVPYQGHVRLTTAPLPAAPARLQAFRLAAPASVASPRRVMRLARSLGIQAPLRRTTQGHTHTPWLVAAQGGASRRPLHSIAVATTMGELVYHDAGYTHTARPRWHNPRLVTAARAWLTRLGWPGTRMTFEAVRTAGVPAGVRSVEFSWVGVGSVATDAATLWVTPGGRVVEADVWPPVERGRSIAVRSIAAAWTAVRGHVVPLAVEGVPPNAGAPGVGMMRGVTITYVLSTGTDQRLYLVPTYHFAGPVRLRGIHGQHVCYALAPAGQETTRT